MLSTVLFSFLLSSSRERDCAVSADSFAFNDVSSFSIFLDFSISVVRFEFIVLFFPYMILIMTTVNSFSAFKAVD